MKLEIKHLAPYLPYGLKCEYEGIINGKEISAQHKAFNIENDPFPNWEYYEPIEEVIGLKIAPLKSIRTYKKYFLATCGIHNRGLKNFYNGIGIKPILRPLSDLTKEIEYNGEKFVPIEFLFNNLVDAADVIEFDYEFKEEIKPVFQIDDGWNHCMSLKNDYGHILCFSFDSNSKSFMLGIESRPGVEWCNISNQYEMFQKLFEWHFDIFGLIENKLAIDINTITK